MVCFDAEDFSSVQHFREYVQLPDGPPKRGMGRQSERLDHIHNHHDDRIHLLLLQLRKFRVGLSSHRGRLCGFKVHNQVFLLTTE